MVWLKLRVRAELFNYKDYQLLYQALLSRLAGGKRRGRLRWNAERD